jgi:hypothetical protein
MHACQRSENVAAVVQALRKKERKIGMKLVFAPKSVQNPVLLPCY